MGEGCCWYTASFVLWRVLVKRCVKRYIGKVTNISGQILDVNIIKLLNLRRWVPQVIILLWGIDLLNIILEGFKFCQDSIWRWTIMTPGVTESSKIITGSLSVPNQKDILANFAGNSIPLWYYDLDIRGAVQKYLRKKRWDFWPTDGPPAPPPSKTSKQQIPLKDSPSWKCLSDLFCRVAQCMFIQQPQLLYWGGQNLASRACNEVAKTKIFFSRKVLKIL